IAAMESADALALFDAAVGTTYGAVIPVRFDFGALRAEAVDGSIQSVFRGLVRVPVKRAAVSSANAVDGLQAKLAGLGAEDRAQALLEIVQSTAATVLGYSRVTDLEVDRGLLEVG